jgi:prepilin-type N-terminal cleavage/methylation domain-containing protein
MVHRRFAARRAFTIVELLVVISIVALLISILLPSLKKAREVAYDMKCSVNFKTQGMGFYQFSQEHHGYCPSAELYPFPEGLGRYIWAPYNDVFYDPAYLGYAGQGQAYYTANTPKCPSFICPAVATPQGDNSDPEGCLTNSQYLHYAMGMWTTGYSYFSTPEQVDLDTFSDLARFIPAGGDPPDHSYGNEYWASRKFFSDQPISDGTNNYRPWELCIAGESCVYWYLNGDPTGTVRYRHFGKTNIICADLSVKKASRLSAYGYQIFAN